MTKLTGLDVNQQFPSCLIYIYIYKLSCTSLQSFHFSTLGSVHYRLQLEICFFFSSGAARDVYTAEAWFGQRSRDAVHRLQDSSRESFISVQLCAQTSYS